MDVSRHSIVVVALEIVGVDLRRPISVVITPIGALLAVKFLSEAVFLARRVILVMVAIITLDVLALVWVLQRTVSGLRLLLWYRIHGRSFQERAF